VGPNHEGRGDLVISDVVMPDGNGLETLPKINQQRPDLPVIIISAQNTIMTAIQATEAAAYDYLPKPFDLPDLMKRSARAIAKKAETLSPNAHAVQHETLPLVGQTPVMQEIYRIVAKILNTDMPVLISGPSGSGKSLITRIIHDYSDRSAQPYIVANSVDMDSQDTADSLLSRAKSGSVLFDEIGDLSAQAQSRLVRILDQHTENPPRIMATSQRDLAQAVEAGHFRADLYYRISAVSLSVPPLHLRIDDIELLAQHFLAKSARERGETKQLDPLAYDHLRKFAWPGNVRQLENTLKRLVTTCPQEIIQASDVDSVLGPVQNARQIIGLGGGQKLSEAIASHLGRYFDLHGANLPPSGLYARILREMETPLIEIALEATAGNQAKCADLLGINRNTLRKKIGDLEIRVTRGRKLM